ncbi:MAG TPA: hypothetical protein VK698_24470 [Kofleriaceae bacterium]|nr:hypothetical protein [Kofleriaceae bacterium]
MRGWSVVAALLSLVAVTGCAYKAQTRAQGWVMVETEHIRLRTSLSRSRAIELAREMQVVRDVLAGNVVRCPVIADDDKVAVTILPASRFTEIAPPALAGFQRRAKVTWLADYESAIVMRDDLSQDARQVFQHELSHRLMAMCLPRAPVWLDEGMASLVETALVKAGKVEIGIPPYVLVPERIQPRAGYFRDVRVVVLSTNLLPPIRDLMGINFFAASAGGGEHGLIRSAANYAAAWALVHMLMVGDVELRPRFVAFQQDLIHSETDPKDLFLKHFEGVPLQERLDAYIAGEKFALVRRPVAVPPRAAPRIRAMATGEANLHWAWLWSTLLKDGDAASHRREHLFAAMKDPGTRADAYVLKALLRLDGPDEDWAGAERDIEEGLRLEPDAPAVLHARIDLLLRRGADASVPAERLRRVARTSEQRCAVARVDLASGRARQSLVLATAGLKHRPSSWTCRKTVEQARDALAGAPGS